jgi:hypothetical protein
MLNVTNIVEDHSLMVKYGQDAAVHHPQNFANFEKRIPNYTDFFIVTWNNEPVAMSGIYQYSGWPSDHYRVVDRSFYFPEFRTKSLGYHLPEEMAQLRSILTGVLLPMQTQIVLSKGGVPFYSMLGHPNALAKQVRMYNENNKQKYTILNSLYYTCPNTPSDDKNCWQDVAVLEDKQHEFNLPRQSQ